MSDSNTRPLSLAVTVVAVAVVTAAAALRFYQLDARPVHYDEGVHAYYAWQFAVEGEFEYDPWRHGPLLYYLTAPLMWLLDDSIVMGRATVAAVSLAMFPALYLLRRDLPRSALLFAATVLAVHPYALRTGRLYRNDALLATFCLLLIGLYAAYRRAPSRPLAIGVGATVGLAFATKEAAFLLVPTIALPVAVVAHFDGRFTGREVDELVARYAPSRHAPAVIVAGILVVVLFYSNWPPDPANVDGFMEGLLYWLDRGESGSVKATYYVDRLIGATPGLALFAAVGTIGTLLRTDSSWLRWLFLSWGGVATLVLSLLPDQSWYNVILVFPPVAMLAGCGAHDAYHVLTRAFRGVSTQISSGRMSAESVDALMPVLFAILLITGGVALPNVTANEDDLGEREVAGITAAKEDTRKQAFLFAREQAIETNCPVLIGPNEYAWPGPWFLRDVDFERIETLNEAYWPAVIINREPIRVLAEPTSDEHRRGQYWIYVPGQDCSGE